MKINIFRSGLINRKDLDRVYYYEECNKTLAYAEEKMSVNGVLEYYKKMKVEKTAYISDIDRIVNPEKEKEEKQYLLWEKWTKIRQISAWTCIIAFIIGIICEMINLPSIIGELLALWLAPAAFLIFLVAKIGETVCGTIYNRLVQDIMEKIRAREKQFIALCQKYYKEIDDLYLDSLDPTTLQVVLMRRELAAANKKNEELQKAMINEQRQMRESQERMEDEQKWSRQIQQGILDNLNEWKEERHNRY